MGQSKILLVHHFPLSYITGVTVMIAEILRIFPAIGDSFASYLSLSDSPEALIAELDDKHSDATSVIGINLHIEVQFDSSLALVEWCAARGIPVWVYIHDYWPHHFNNVALMVGRGARLLASTPFLQESLAADGYSASVVPVGVPLSEQTPPFQPSSWPDIPKVFASAGRLVPRKRFPDIARAFREAALDGRVSLYLRLLPSHVFGSSDDEEQIRLIQAEILGADRLEGRVRLDLIPRTEFFDYSVYFAYVCSSAYEGFSMGPIEAAYSGSPPLMSDIPAHQAIAHALFPDHADDFLYPLGDTAFLAGMMRDEVVTQRRRRFLAAHSDHIRRTIETRWSLANTSRALARLAKSHST